MQKRTLTEQDISFSDEIIEIDGCLNFYMDCSFDVDAVFGTHVETFDNDDWINVYASYDIQDRAVCDTLLIILSRPQYDEEMLYVLDDAEKELLASKMNHYCIAQENMTLEQCCDKLQAEEAEMSCPGQSY